MIDVLIGSQGSGKSLTSIHYLFEEIETTIVDDYGKEKVVKVPRHRLYKRLITNVGGFKVDLFRQYSGNYDIEIKHYDKFLYKEDLVEIFQEQMLEAEKPQEDRTPTLFIYDECQFGLSTFSVSKDMVETCEFISNFFSLQRHYGPCDILLMTQSADKIHRKYLGDDFHLYISLEYSKKKDPENDIVFDLYDCDGKSIITGGRNKINFKKTKKLIDVNGNEFNPFDLYVSGDAGRKPVKKKSYWTKYIYLLLFLVVAVIGTLFYVFYSMFNNMDNLIKDKNSSDVNTSVVFSEKNTKSKILTSKNIMNRLPVRDVKPSSYDKYIEAPYHNIDAQVIYKVFVLNGVYYIGSQLLTKKMFDLFVKDKKIFVVSRQPVTNNSLYINVLIHQSLLNSFGLVKDFDKSNDKRVKSSTKNN